MVNIRYKNNNQNAEEKRDEIRARLEHSPVKSLRFFAQETRLSVSRKRPTWNLMVPECWISYGGSRNVYITGSICNICDLLAFWFVDGGLYRCVRVHARALCGECVQPRQSGGLWQAMIQSSCICWLQKCYWSFVSDIKYVISCFLVCNKQ